ncbi:MAG: MJ0042-type zinc finger domain-containing protein [Isosphaeraceae bacterium]
MLILCPNCRHAIRVRDLRPGRFTPRCPRCEHSFQMTIPDQPGKTPIVSPVDPSVFAEPLL